MSCRPPTRRQTSRPAASGSRAARAPDGGPARVHGPRGLRALLEALPLTPNGKLDRKALPAPDDEAFARQAYEPPQGELEQALAAIWSELLGIERVGRHDNFFELGGHSLLAVQLFERLRRLGLNTEVRRLFATPRLADLANEPGQP